VGANGVAEGVAAVVGKHDEDVGVPEPVVLPDDVDAPAVGTAAEIDGDDRNHGVENVRGQDLRGRLIMPMMLWGLDSQVAPPSRDRSNQILLSLFPQVT